MCKEQFAPKPRFYTKNIILCFAIFLDIPTVENVAIRSRMQRKLLEPQMSDYSARFFFMFFGSKNDHIFQKNAILDLYRQPTVHFWNQHKSILNHFLYNFYKWLTFKIATVVWVQFFPKKGKVFVPVSGALFSATTRFAALSLLEKRRRAKMFA